MCGLKYNPHASLFHRDVSETSLLVNMMDFILNMMDVVLNMMHFVLTMMDFVLKTMKSILKVMSFTGRPALALSRRKPQGWI